MMSIRRHDGDLPLMPAQRDRQPRDRAHWEQKEESPEVRLGAPGILRLDTGPGP